MLQQFAREPTHVLAGGVKHLNRGENRRDVALEDCAGETFEGAPAHQAEHAQGVFFGHLVALEGNELVEGRERVAHAALGTARDGEERILLRVDLLLLANVLEAGDDIVRLDAPKVEALAARDNRRQDLVPFGRRKDEAHVRRRFLECLQERIPRRVRQHMTFVDDEDLVLRRGRLELDGVDDGLHVLDFVVRGGVKLGHVDRASGRDLPAVVAFPTRFDALRTRAIERLRENARERGLADAARTDEEIGVGDAVRLDGVAKGADDVLLSNDIVKRHRTVLERER